MKRSLIITICGSLKFKDEIVKQALKMELAGNVVLMPIFPVESNKIELTNIEIITLGDMHKEKIKLSDAIFVVNVNGYIGSSTKSEIEYATKLNKEVLYLNQPIGRSQ